MIYLRIVGGTGLDSWSVKRITRSWASHAEFLDTDRKVAFGAYLSGVAERPINYARFDREERYTARGITFAYEWARTQLGKKYDYSAIFGIALDRNWKDQGKWFCSELCSAAFDITKAPLFNPLADPWRITPRDLLLSLALVRVSNS